MPHHERTPFAVSSTVSTCGRVKNVAHKTERHMQDAASSAKTPRPLEIDKAHPHQLLFSSFGHPKVSTMVATPCEKDSRTHRQMRPSASSSGSFPNTATTESSSSDSQRSSQKLRGRYYPPSVPAESHTITSLRSASSTSPLSVRHRQSTPTSSNSILVLGTQGECVPVRRKRQQGDTIEHKLFQTQFGFGTPGLQRKRGVPDAR